MPPVLRLDDRYRRLDRGLVGHVHRDGKGVGTDGLRGFLGTRKVDVCDGHRRPFAHISRRERRSDPPRRSGDQGRFACEPGHGVTASALGETCR